MRRELVTPNGDKRAAVEMPVLGLVEPCTTVSWPTWISQAVRAASHSLPQGCTEMLCSLPKESHASQTRGRATTPGATLYGWEMGTEGG